MNENDGRVYPVRQSPAADKDIGTPPRGPFRRPWYADLWAGSLRRDAEWGSVNVAAEVKVLRNEDCCNDRSELARGLGQCLMYAGRFDAAALLVVHWSTETYGALDLDARPWCGIDNPTVILNEGCYWYDFPIYCFHRPLVWGEASKVAA